uniref:Oxysterol-binding protein n=1 Tax=Eptatretus burgeri TaxID=7764 RepID=A0A8C4R8F3_EPTBU
VELKAGLNTHIHLEKHKGWLFKKRKWPLKGWHKMKRGKLHGSMDVSAAALLIKKKALCIDLDNEEGIYHLKVQWVVHHKPMSNEKQSNRAKACNDRCKQRYLSFFWQYCRANKCGNGSFTLPRKYRRVSKQEVTLHTLKHVPKRCHKTHDFEILFLKKKMEGTVEWKGKGFSDDGEIGLFQTGRRTQLPAQAPEIRGVGLWEILRKNIGKDLSKVVMPVELNEPVNTLQRLCEELEYSELLDRASERDDPAQRMVLVAAFVVSALACTATRAGRKPFNPLLGETYECVREDHGFKFHAEQVSHHPPISACHCESRNFNFWQDIRWKNKFWGKSMEIVPEGTVHVTLPKYGDHYSWNKVASCIHNILAGQRWIEHYGEINIVNHNDKSCHCKLSFLKASYWSSNCNEVHGSVYDKDGRVLHHLFGTWNEGIHCGTQRTAKCIWRPGTLPTEHELYYGFTRFAIELNEMDPATKTLLPPTDTRFRPDQRFLEEGNLEAASESKLRLEEQQRKRRQLLEENNIEHKPRFFKKVKGSDGKESWIDNGTYWDLRKDPGFVNLEHALLW